MNVILERIQDAIARAPTMYSRLVLLIGPAGSGKTTILRDLSAQINKPIINVNLEMSKALLELPVQRRESRTARIFNEIIGDAVSVSEKSKTHGREDAVQEPAVFEPVVLLDNLEIIFDKTLSQNPLVLLESVSRNTTIIASWNGTYSNKRLTFARTGHPEYRCYDEIHGQIIECKKETLL